MGDVGPLRADNIKVEQERLRELLCSSHVDNKAKTDEVGVLFRLFSSGTVNPQDHLNASPRIKDLIVAVLIVFANGKKSALVVIGKSKRPTSFPLGFEPSELGIYHYAQKKSRNARYLWKEQLAFLNSAFKRQHRNVLHFIDSCSAHVDSQSYSNIKTQLMPPQMTCALHPVQPAIG